MSAPVAVNFALSAVAAGYDASATSINLVSGGGARMPTPPFKAVWWKSSTYANPASDPKVEIITVNSKGGEPIGRGGRLARLGEGP